MVLQGAKVVARSETLQPLEVKLAEAVPGAAPDRRVNYAVNNDGNYFPRVTASHTGPRSSITKLIDGNYWYHLSPPNRWTTEGSATPSDWCVIDLGTPRKVHTVQLYVLDDGEKVVAPAKIDLEYWDGKGWATVPEQMRTPEQPTGRRANVIHFPEMAVQKLRAVLTHRDGSKSGLSEFEVWGDGPAEAYEPPPMPAGNLAFNPAGRPFPKAAASFTSRFDKVASANDGKVSFSPSPHNRWTSYESPNTSDWLEIDFGEVREFRRVELAIYDDRGGVQAPEKFEVQSWDGRQWLPVPGARHRPEKPTGGQFNEVVFEKVKANKLRVVFTHRGKSRSGVSEIFVWER
jgi:hypothetical protein